MIKINKDMVLVIFLIVIIGITCINNKDNIKKIDIAQDLLLEEAKFYGVDINIDEKAKNTDLKNYISIEEARFWGVSQAF
ncbi:hypothetical protein [Maledivibacter halophilus]|uniref:Uncharacterized protein n=1 Tax=Maledivibacter halophilus TaxID=36842 RepID=A0A1T5M5H2_9FIRM|nr:hypothetical protein [Maledivibacter halophilus]SKC83482.1 hypothetical protein SAMN02194393_03919 [Maledivibacter halophilus]